ncbi:DNA replication complex GINS protein SLD5 [Scheffersomyces xylosifermentans]|uniref:DNA replication complex GINS protein SLD5 n=1 Tax=Scheffersomyces xylosifermentans TaxID=1304137 RepID=UPI00315DBDA9
MASNMDIDDILQEFDNSSKASLKKQKKLSSSTPNIYDELVTAMLNERMAPEILPYKHELMTQVLEQISNQQQYLLDSHEYGDLNAQSGVVSGDFKLQLMIIETDVERINYLVRLYLRTRLSKIDKFTIHYINETADAEESNSSLLSREETEYMHQHFKILTQLYNNCFLKKMPHTLTLLDDTTGGESMIVTPDVNQPVFIKSVTKAGIIIPLGEEDELELEENGIYVVKYSLIRRYIEIGDVVLI